MIMRMIRIIDIKNCNEVVLELPYSEWKSILTCLRPEDDVKVKDGSEVRLGNVDLLMFLQYFRDKADLMKMYEVAMMLYWTAGHNEFHTFNIVIDEVKR